MNIIQEVEKWAEDLWNAIREHVAPDAEAAAKAVLDDGKAQVAELAKQAASDAKADAEKAAGGAAQALGNAEQAVGGIGVPESGANPVAAQAPAQAPAPAEENPAHSS